MHRRITAVGLFFALLFAPLLLAPATAQETMAAPESLTGCLNPGAEEGHFVLTTEGEGEEGGQEVQVQGGAEIAAHAANHKVVLTGEWAEDEAGNEYFAASAIEHLGTCE